MYAIILHMNDALDLCDRAADAVAAALGDGSQFDAQGLRSTALGMQHHIDRMKVHQAKVLHEAERVRAWEGTGARNIADWLAGKTKSSRAEAKNKAKLGEALKKSKELDDAVGNGELSPDAAAQLHDAVTNPPDGADIGELVNAVKGATPDEARDAAARWKELNSNDSPEAVEDRRFQKRSITSGPTLDGMVNTHVTLPVLQHRQVINAISHAAGKPCDGDQRTNAQRLADGLIALCDAYAKGEVKGGREKPTILITFTADAYSGNTNEPGVTAQGDPIPAHIVRHIAEYANLHRVLLAGSKVLDLGRDVRYATDDQYKALVARDGGCRWNGCTIPAGWCEVDHLQAWDDGGPSNLDNEALWCTFHHHEKHRPGVQVLGNANNLRLRLANGQTINCPPNRPRMTAAA